MSYKLKSILIGLIIVLFIVAVGVLYYQNQQQQKAREEQMFFEQQQQTQEVQQYESEELIRKGHSEEITHPEEVIDSKDSSATKNIIEIKGYAFQSKMLTVKAGTRITFINRDTVEHSATADDGSFDTGNLKQNEVDTVLFAKAGNYTYHCVPHPNMRGTIIVE